MEQSFGSRLKHAWNVFRSRDPTAEFRDIGVSYYNRPDRPRFTRGNERSITTSVLNRIALDASAIDILHVRYKLSLILVNDIFTGVPNLPHRSGWMIEGIQYGWYP